MAEQKMYIAARTNDIDTIRECIAKKRDRNYDSENRHVGSHAFMLAVTEEHYELAKYIFGNIELDIKTIEDDSILEIFKAPLLAELVIDKFPKEIQNYILQHGITKYFSFIKHLPGLYLNNAILYSAVENNNIYDADENAVRGNNLEILELFNSKPALYNDSWKDLIIRLNKSKLLLDPNKRAVQIILNSEYSRQNNYNLYQLIEQDCFSIKLVDYLLNLGADLNFGTKECPTPLSATADLYSKEAEELFIYLIKLGSEINLSTREKLPYLYYLFDRLITDKTTTISCAYFDKVFTALKYGADPFIIIYPENFPEGIPLLHHLIARIPSGDPRYASSMVLLLSIISFARNGLNVLDSWGRNLLFYISPNSDRYYSFSAEITEHLIKLGVDPDHRALIDDQQKVVTAKLNGTLPKDYGKTPREILEGRV